jgi:hypothetical protein
MGSFLAGAAADADETGPVSLRSTAAWEEESPDVISDNNAAITKAEFSSNKHMTYFECMSAPTA